MAHKQLEFQCPGDSMLLAFPGTCAHLHTYAYIFKIKTNIEDGVLTQTCTGYTNIHTSQNTHIHKIIPKIPGAGVSGGLSNPVWDWELTLNPLEEQAMLLNAEPSLHPMSLSIFSCSSLLVCGVGSFLVTLQYPQTEPISLG